MNYLVTGFKPWSTHDVNPAEIAAKFAGSLGFPFAVYPVSYPIIDDVFKEQKLDRVLLFGLAGRRSEISLERFAYNEFDARLKDVDGVCPTREEIFEGEAKRLETKLDIEALGEALKRQGIPNHVSTDPGRYLCNDIYYHALRCSNGNAIFVHLPPLSETFTEETLRQAVTALCKELFPIDS